MQGILILLFTSICYYYAHKVFLSFKRIFRNKTLIWQLNRKFGSNFKRLYLVLLVSQFFFFNQVCFLLLTKFVMSAYQQLTHDQVYKPNTTTLTEAGQQAQFIVTVAQFLALLLLAVPNKNYYYFGMACDLRTIALYVFLGALFLICNVTNPSISELKIIEYNWNLFISIGLVQFSHINTDFFLTMERMARKYTKSQQNQIIKRQYFYQYLLQLSFLFGTTGTYHQPWLIGILNLTRYKIMFVIICLYIIILLFYLPYNIIHMKHLLAQHLGDIRSYRTIMHCFTVLLPFTIVVFALIQNIDLIKLAAWTGSVIALPLNIGIPTYIYLTYIPHQAEHKSLQKLGFKLMLVVLFGVALLTCYAVLAV